MEHLEEYNIMKLEKRQQNFLHYKERHITKLKEVQLDISFGLEPPLTQEEIDWYTTVRNFVVTINSEFPPVPERFNVE